MTTRSTPEARALLFVFFFVMASVMLHMVTKAFERIDSAETMAHHATGTSEELQNKILEIGMQVEELKEKLAEFEVQMEELQ